MYIAILLLSAVCGGLLSLVVGQSTTLVAITQVAALFTTCVFLLAVSMGGMSARMAKSNCTVCTANASR